MMIRNSTRVVFLLYAAASSMSPANTGLSTWYLTKNPYAQAMVSPVQTGTSTISVENIFSSFHQKGSDAHPIAASVPQIHPK